MHGILAQEGGPLEVVFTSTETTYLWVIFGDLAASRSPSLTTWSERSSPHPEGTEKMKEIARAIQEGAKAYLSRQFRTLGIFLALLTVVLFFILPAPENAVALGVRRSSSDGRSPSSWVPASARSPGTRGCGSRSEPTSGPRTPHVSRGCAVR